ncbi:hypothetical protein PRUPE_8G052400 [Prunus persica]|uniref:Uncharacterized protein n=1 Tax=Prunus persica TaxID=3760 RepID=A0A251MTI6_PRUPE|nr:hypothetical protein PRUPE_8G052400 [Prunus persica]
MGCIQVQFSRTCSCGTMQPLILKSEDLSVLPFPLLPLKFLMSSAMPCGIVCFRWLLPLLITIECVHKFSFLPNKRPIYFEQCHL